MRAVRFNKVNHLNALLRMYESQGAYIPKEHEIPKIGYIIVDKDEFVAACFLRKVEGGFGQIDGLVSNPLANSEQRHSALDLAIDKCLKAASKHGIKQLISFIRDVSALMRSNRHGFVKHDQYVLVTLQMS